MGEQKQKEGAHQTLAMLVPRLSRTRENKCLLFRAPNAWQSVIVVLVKTPFLSVLVF